MASVSTSQALTKRSADIALMPPPPPTKRIKRPAIVLDEDTYTDALSHIIARDFFPGLLETKSQEDYLNALESRDEGWIAAAGRRLTEVMTPGPDGRRLRGRRGTSMTPMSGLHGMAQDTPKAWQGDTPISTISAAESTSEPKSANVDTNMSLSAFQQKYTSEDNESFYKLLDKQNSKWLEKYSWMWAGNKIPAARQIAHRKREEQKLLAAGDKPATAEVNGKEVALIRPEDEDKRKAMPDSWSASTPDNNFMFAPSSIEDSLETIAQKAEETSKAPPKAVVYDNTRLANPTATAADSEIPPSPSLSAIQDAIAGRPRPTASEAAFGGGRADTPRVNGYAFVDSQEPSAPSPPPASSTLSLFSNSTGDKTPNPFTIKETNKREALHHRMVDKVAKSKRVKSQVEAVKTPVPRFMSSPRVAKGGLTPAAQRLLGKVGAEGPRTPGLWEKGKKRGSRLREGWTPRG
ncbi:MAG: hypothetical protein LQ350_001190 [Teloschistes chrysophthalmus]|nr:MAG: hypothetical protein LQ350_001190 [Niorma chrysophthalma]